VRVEAATLFSPGDDAYLHDLVARLFRSRAVQAVDVERGHRAFVIRYDPALDRAESALRLFAEALDVPSGDLPLRESLKLIPGPVRRVERRRANFQRNQALAHTGPVGAGLRPVTPVARPGSTVRESIALAPDDQPTIILEPEDLIVSYDRLEALPPALARLGSPAHWPRVVNLVLGGASFVMSVVGILLPFVPTMPFVLATGYFLALASPRLNDLFRRSPLFGEMLCDWEDFGGWRLRTKLKLFGLMAFVWGVTLAIVGVSPGLVISMGLVSSISVVVILRVPTVSENHSVARMVPATA
jgi:uncharacterized membrane protein YbaN (DUF454 family)